MTVSYFAGVQRYAAIQVGCKHFEHVRESWTWVHLRKSLSMCLTAAINGISFCGVYMRNTFDYFNSEILLRWYQVSELVYCGSLAIRYCTSQIYSERAFSFQRFSLFSERITIFNIRPWTCSIFRGRELR
jgi:hypothetical protein